MSPDEEERRALLNVQKENMHHDLHENENFYPGKSKTQSSISCQMWLTDYDTDDEVEDDSRAVLDIYREKNKSIRAPNARVLLNKRYYSFVSFCPTY